MGSGVYLYRVVSQGVGVEEVRTGRFILLKRSACIFRRRLDTVFRGKWMGIPTPIARLPGR